MVSGLIALVVGASAAEFAHVEQCLSDWQCVNAPLDDDEETAVSPIPAGARLMIVYARKDGKNTLAICEQLRNAPDGSTVPILLVIGRYEITQAIEVKRLGKATFIVKSFGEKSLRDKIAELLASS